MPHRTTFRCSDKLREKIEKDTLEQGLESVNDWLNEASEHYLTCKKAEIAQNLKLIPLKYAGRCLKCGKVLDAGTWAMWGRGVGVICTDCFIQKFGDKATVKLVMREKEIRWKIKALNKELDGKAEQYRTFNFYEIINTVHQQSTEIHKLIVQYLKTNFDKPEQEKQTLDNLEKLSKKQWALVQDADRFMRVPIKKPKKKKREAE